MLVRMLRRRPTPARSAWRRRGDDAGAALVPVLVVMVVGFLVVTLVGAAAMFATQATQRDAERAQAFIAAESGRDAALSRLVSGTCTPTVTGTDPVFTATVHAVSGATPTGAGGHPAACPGASTTHVVIRAEGTAGSGATLIVEAVYEWQQPIVRLGGSVGGSGGFSALASTYSGDLVIRSGNFDCTVAAAMNGDVYVLSGNANILGLCLFGGNLYVSGNVTGIGLITGRIVAHGSVSPLVIATGGRSSGPFTPTADVLRERTEWFDLNETTVWPGFTTAATLSGTCNTVATRDEIVDLLQTSGAPIVIDATACTDRIDLGTAFTSITMRRDAVLLVDQGFRFASGTLGSASGRKLYVVQTNTSLDPAHPAPHCASRPGIEITVSSAFLSSMPDMLVYSPCSVVASGAAAVNLLSSFRGQIIAPPSSSWNLLASTTCRPFHIPGLLDLVCDVSAGGSGPGGSTPGSLGALLSQTER